MIDLKLLELLACPTCKSDLLEKCEKLVCSNKHCHEVFEVVEGIPIMLSGRQRDEREMKITRCKWEWVYKECRDEYYNSSNVPRTIQVSSSYIEKYIGTSAKTFLEAGCGTARSSLRISESRDLTVVCLDITLEALLIAQKLFHENNKPAFFVCGDLRSLPFKNGVFDFIFSDGAIEHFKETHKAISELFRVLKEGGGLLVTVPHISISMLTLGQLRGDIPNVAILRQALEFIRMRLLNGRLMKNGYELSFTQSQLKNLLHKFSRVEVGLYHTFHELNWVRNKLLREIIRKVSRNKLFCPLIYAAGIKTE